MNPKSQALTPSEVITGDIITPASGHGRQMLAVAQDKAIEIKIRKLLAELTGTVDYELGEQADYLMLRAILSGTGTLSGLTGMAAEMYEAHLRGTVPALSQRLQDTLDHLHGRNVATVLETLTVEEKHGILAWIARNLASFARNLEALE